MANFILSKLSCLVPQAQNRVGSPYKTPESNKSVEQLPSYSPDFIPSEHLWKKVKKEATHLKYFPEFTHLQAEVDRALLHFAHTPREITVLMARYCETLGAMAA